MTHSGADLDTAFSMAHGHMDGDTCWKIDDMLKNRNEWCAAGCAPNAVCQLKDSAPAEAVTLARTACVRWVPGKIAQVRESLQWNWKSEGSSRDVMLLDIALDNYFRTCIERADAGSMSGDDLLAVIELVSGLAPEQTHPRRWRLGLRGDSASRYSPVRQQVTDRVLLPGPTQRVHHH